MPTYNDRPVQHLDDDALNFADYAPALKSIITTGDTPLTVGVFGAWGSGKSSLLRMLRSAVEADQRYPVRTVWFTAWKYDRQEALWRTLILRVLEALYPRESGEGPREEREIVAAGEGSREAQLVDKLDRLAEAVYQPVSWEEVGPRDVKWWQLISNVGGASADIVATLASAGMWSKFKELRGGDGVPAEEIRAAAEAISKGVIQQQQRQLRYMEDFEKRFAEAIQLLEHDAARLIVFIDDLDRCLPEKAIEVLEAIKLFLEVEGAVFVLGMDQEIIRRGIEARYGELFRQRVERGGELPIGGDLYLQKIVQIPFHLPALATEDVGAFIETLGAELSERTRESFARGLHRNPRQVKRALNIFQLLKEIAEARVKRDALAAGAIAWPLLAKTVVVQTQYPQLYQQWRLRPTLLRTLERRYDRLLAGVEAQRKGETVAPGPGEGPAVESYAAAAEDGGILDDYLWDTAANLYLREMLTYPAIEDAGEGYERARFRGLERHEIQRYVRLAGSITVAPEREEVVLVQLDLAEFLSGDAARIEEAMAILHEEKEGKLGDAYREQLAMILQDETRPVRERVSAGISLGELGDPRPGVGVIERDGVRIPDIVWGEEVPAGTYPYQDGEARIERPYRLARYPITNAQFQCFVDAPDREDPRWWEGLPEDEQQFTEPTFPFANHPRETVSWYQAVAFSRWLGDKMRDEISEGAEIDLPDEQEWEVAARRPDGRRQYPWGGEADEERANTAESGIGRTTAVGIYPSGRNPALDLYDLSGNVWEWCLNVYADPEDVAIDEDSRALRGGSFDNNRKNARATYRANNRPGIRLNRYGFRVVLRRPASRAEL